MIIVDPTTQTYYDLWQVRAIDGQGQLPVSNGTKLPNYLSSNGQLLPSRGVGLAYFAMLITPEEVLSGTIPHAISMGAVRSSSPEFVAPAIKSDGLASGGIPEGTRFALTMTDQQLESWVNTKPTNLRPLARAIGYALRDYGWVVTDTGGGAIVQLEDIASSHQAWADITGLPNLNQDVDSLRNLLDGLDWTNTRVLSPR